MKTIYLIMALAISATMLHAQQTIRMYVGPLLSVNNDLQTIKQDVIGTPYFNASFLPAMIGSSMETVPTRYDAHLDKFEVLVDGKVYQLPINEDLSTIRFKDINVNFIYLKEENGYYVKLSEGAYQLLKKLKINIETVRPSIEPNSTIKEGYTKFAKLKLTYYLKTPEKTLAFPKNTKHFVELFPDKKEALNNFIKLYKIKFNNEEDLIKLVNFLNK